MELPPRARRILFVNPIIDYCSGTTSACAENTTGGPGRTKFGRNYLRVRGEYPVPLINCDPIAELPPRARRIPPGRINEAVIGGTTSACAENTRTQLCRSMRLGNYLRVRGEYRYMLVSPQDFRELPPRARRIRGWLPITNQITGTTSACAENTLTRDDHASEAWNYLRVRGEYHYPIRNGEIVEELPPRARRILALVGRFTN